MKKLLILVVSVVAIVAVACGGAAAPEGEPTQTPPSDLSALN